jgi:hypothetical protein
MIIMWKMIHYMRNATDDISGTVPIQLSGS